MSLLRLSSVTKSYPRGRRPHLVLRDASLELDRGSLVSVYGGRDAGKTTLLRIAAGFEPPDGGSVSIDGRGLAELSRRQLLALRRDALGWVNRDGPHDRSLTMAAYVGLALYGEQGPRRARTLAVQRLSAIGGGEYANDNWEDLPDLARALCSIAQATVRRPRLLIADDPMAGLGLIERERICTVLGGLAGDGLAVLIAAPELPPTLHAHETRALIGGRLISAADRHTDDGAEVIAFPHRRSA